MRIVGRSSERNSYEVLFELREENRETHSIQKVRFLLRTMPRIVHDHPMSLSPQYRLFIFTSKMVRGVGFEPTKAYATGSPRSPVIPRDHLSLAPSDFEVARSCPLDLVPAWLVRLARDSGTPAHQLVSLLTQQNITPSNLAA